MEADFARVDTFFGQSPLVLVRAEIRSKILKNTATLGLESIKANPNLSNFSYRRLTSCPVGAISAVEK